jgi:hypothetical protein
VLGRDSAMKTVLVLFLLIPLMSLAGEFRITCGMSYHEAMDVVRKQGGVNITTNVGWVIAGLRKSDTNSTQKMGPPRWSFWELRNYDAVILLVDLYGRYKISSLSHWATPDFNDWKHRHETMHDVVSLTFDPGKKTIEREVAPDGGSRPNQPRQPTPGERQACIQTSRARRGCAHR